MSQSELLNQFRKEHEILAKNIGGDDDIIEYALRFLISNAEDLEDELDDEDDGFAEEYTETLLKS